MTVKSRGKHAQRGITLFGLLFWAIIIGMGSLVAIKIVPTAIEYFTIMKAINKVSGDSSATTVPQIRAALDRKSVV